MKKDELKKLADDFSKLVKKHKLDKPRLLFDTKNMENQLVKNIEGVWHYKQNEVWTKMKEPI